MSDDKVEVEGVVLEVCRGGKFKCEFAIPGDKEDKLAQVLAYTSGKMKKFAIKIVVGDRVKIELSPYDLSQGRIVFRDR